MIDQAADVTTTTNNTAGKKALRTGGLAHFVHDGFTDMLYIFFPVWQTQFSLSFAEIGFLKTLYSGTMASFQVPAGFLAQRIGEVRLLLWGTILTSVAVCLYSEMAAPWALGCLLVAGGLGASVQHPLSSSLISGAYMDATARRTALSSFNVAGDLGKLLLPAGASLLMSVAGWQTASQVLGLLGLVAAAVLFQLGKSLRQYTRQQQKKRGTTLRLQGATLSFWSLLLIGVIDSSTRMGFLTFFPFLLQAKGAGVATIGLALSLIFAGGALGKFVCGILATKIGVLRSVIFTELLTAACIIGMLTLPLPLEIALAPFLGVALNGTSSVLYGTVPDLVAEESTQPAFAVFYTATIVAGAVAPWAYGVLSDGIGISASVVLVALMVLLTIPCTLPLRGKVAV